MEKSMPWFILKNLIRMAVLLLLVSAAAFFLVSASPLDPLKTNVGQTALGSMSQEQIAKLEEYWGVGVHKNCGVTEVDVTDGRIDIISENKVYYTDVVKPW